MTPIKPINEIPRWRVDEVERRRVQAGAGKMYLVGEPPFMVVGEYRSAFTALPIIWMLLNDDFYDRRFTAVKVLRMLTREILPRTTALAVAKNVKFTELFGFKPTGETVLVEGQTHYVLRRD